MSKKKNMELIPDGAVIFKGWDDAIVGVTADGQVIYSHERIMDILTGQKGLTHEDAQTWIEYSLYREIAVMRSIDG